MKRVSLSTADGILVQSKSCSLPKNNNELRRCRETEKAHLCVSRDTPVSGTKITSLVLFINSEGPGVTGIQMLPQLGLLTVSGLRSDFWAHGVVDFPPVGEFEAQIGFQGKGSGL